MVGIAFAPIGFGIAVTRLGKALDVPLLPDFGITFSVLWAVLAIPYSLTEPEALSVAGAVLVAAAQWILVGVRMIRWTRQATWPWACLIGLLALSVVGGTVLAALSVYGVYPRVDF